MKRERIQNTQEPITAEELIKAMERINLGPQGEDVNQSNAEVIAARRIVDIFIGQAVGDKESKERKEMVNDALGIDVVDRSSVTEFTIDGKRKTGIIATTSYGTGLSRQEKTPRDLSKRI
ncbi:MAG TPA: hypothetical protein VKC53_00945 [Patescibacteria group bacterium]|nr:hypothetical protein [Patescibacteria group bacterium]